MLGVSGAASISAIDFDRVATPKDHRVKIMMSGKFLPHKYFGAIGNVPEHAFKEG